jgi:hypothetical protein
MLSVYYVERPKKAFYAECHYAECCCADSHGALELPNGVNEDDPFQ